MPVIHKAAKHAIQAGGKAWTNARGKGTLAAAILKCAEKSTRAPHPQAQWHTNYAKCNLNLTIA